MKKRFVFTILASLAMSIFVYAQKGIIRNHKFCKVIAPSGLKLRHAASTSSVSTIAIPFGEVVQVFVRDERTEKIDGLEGQWVSTKYNDHEGFIFSGYLKDQKCSIAEDEIRIVVLNDGSFDVGPLPIHCASWQGLYAIKDEAERYLKEFDILPINIGDTSIYDNRYYTGQFDTSKEDPLFYIGGMNITKSKIKGRYLNERFFPFQQEHIWNEQSKDGKKVQIVAYAKGQGVATDINDSFIGPFREIKDYEFRLRIYQTNKELVDLQLYKEDLGSWGGGYAGGGWLVWIGHLNDDNIPEIIIKTTNTYKGWQYHLLLSDPAAENGIYKKIKVGGGSSC